MEATERIPMRKGCCCLTCKEQLYQDNYTLLSIGNGTWLADSQGPYCQPCARRALYALDKAKWEKWKADHADLIAEGL